MWQCHYCRSSLTLEHLTKNRLCAHCGSDLRSCQNCTHFDENLTSRCREPETPWVADRSKENHCPLFEFHKQISAQHAPPNEAISEAERAKEAFRALFRNT